MTEMLSFVTSFHLFRPAWRSLRVASMIACLIGSCSGCRNPAAADEHLQRYEFSGEMMGTEFRLTMYAPDASTAEMAAEAAFRRIADLEQITSDYRADSELNLLRDRTPGEPVRISQDLFDVLQRAREFSRLSKGAFDVTMGPYVRLWRFARKREVLPSAEEISAASKAVGWQNLKLDPERRTVTLLVPNMRLDLGGIAKGYTADAALALLKNRGITRALVAASGDLAIGDPPPGRKGWKIGVAGLDGEPGEIARTVLLKNAGVSTSGDTEQFIEINGTRYSHILDPATGLGLTRRIQATVIAPNATSSDALATIVCIRGAPVGLALLDSLPETAGLVMVKEADETTRRLLSKRFLRFSQPD